MAAIIASIDAFSPAERKKIVPGDRLISVNGHEIEDVLDYKYYTDDAHLTLQLQHKDGSDFRVRIRKQEGEPVGLNFENYLMDKPRACANRCLFCFVDQLPRGLRKTLYFKDDDARLSFLMGNYITMTNLSERELQRICDLKISPLNISVHATDPQVRARLLGNPKGAEGYALMQRFAACGIKMNCQIVCCPGINDGAVLQRSMEDLAALYPAVASVSIVPVGLTCHRDKLPKLTPFTHETAVETVRQVEDYAESCLARLGSRVFFASDELYLKAGLPIPPEAAYEDYPQIENGVGLLRLLETEFSAALELVSDCTDPKPFSVATGEAAAPFLRALLEKAQAKFENIRGTIYPVKNDFFGHSIDVSGLVTGQDIIRQLKGKPLGERLLIPQSMLRRDEAVFLDDLTPDDVESALGVPVIPVRSGGDDLLFAFLGEDE